MAFMDVKFKSAVLGLDTNVYVVIPTTEPPKDGFKTLYLLHGLSDDNTQWMRRTSIERYASAKNLAVIMPDVNRSFYTDMKCGGNKYWTYVSEELPQFMRRFFRLSDKKERNYAAGLSMGGYGAFKLALNLPDRFAAAGSFSGALNVACEFTGDPEFGQELKNIFGSIEQMREYGGDLVHIINNISNPSGYPKFYQACGTEDFLYKDNQVFLNAAKSANLNLTYFEEPGTHEWGFWDKHVKIFIDEYISDDE